MQGHKCSETEVWLIIHTFTMYTCISMIFSGKDWYIIIKCFHTRADSKLQWRFVIPIFELGYRAYTVHTREKTLHWVCGLAFQSGEKKRGSFGSDMLIAICDRILIRRKWLEVHVALPPKSKFRGQGIHICCVIWEMCHWKQLRATRAILFCCHPPSDSAR